MDIAIKQDNEHLGIQVSGFPHEQDPEQFRAVLQAISNPQTKTAWVDVSGISAINSRGLGLFIVLSNTALTNSVDLGIQGVTEVTRHYFEIAKLDQLFIAKNDNENDVSANDP